MATMAVIYLLATHAPWRPPLIIEPFALDAHVPMVPAAAWIYITYAFLFPALIVLAQNRDGFGKVFATGLACGLANALIYFSVPSRISIRPPAPDGSLLGLIQSLDTPLGALPSGHVALPASIAVACLLASLRLRGKRQEDYFQGHASFWRRMAAGFALWTALLAASTLFTKQHYVPDATSGLAFGILMAGLGNLAVRSWPRFRSLHPPSAYALLRDWSIILVTITIGLHWWSMPMALAAVCVIASRQHAILVLYHDGVHGLVAGNSRVNDFIVNLSVGVPVLLPLHMYRALHQSHHLHLGEAIDPERVVLYRGQPWNYRPLSAGPLALQIAGDVLAWNGIAMIFRYFFEIRRGGALVLPRTRWYPELIGQYAVFLGAWLIAFHSWPQATAHAALLWFLPYLTLTQLLQKIRSFAEHASKEAVENGRSGLSCSWAPGLLGRITIWPYNINYHREHHLRADIPWNLLPAAFPSVSQRPGRDLINHLWKKESR